MCEEQKLAATGPMVPIAATGASKAGKAFASALPVAPCFLIHPDSGVNSNHRCPANLARDKMIQMPTICEGIRKFLAAGNCIDRVRGKQNAEVLQPFRMDKIMDLDLEDYRSCAQKLVPSRLRSHRSVISLVESVSDYSKSISADLSNHEIIAEKGFDVLEALAIATNEDWEIEMYQEWQHQLIPIVGKKQFEPYIIRREVENAVAMYLDLPYRDETLDRKLLDALIASEFAAYLDHTNSGLSTFQMRSLLWDIAIIVGIWWLSDGRPWGWYAIAGVIALRPIAWFFARKLRKKSRDMLLSMRDTYDTLDGQPSSVSQIAKYVRIAEDKGVVWPTPLFVLLEDITERRTAV
jgi:hypothetical protein